MVEEMAAETVAAMALVRAAAAAAASAEVVVVAVAAGLRAAKGSPCRACGWREVWTGLRLRASPGC